MIIIGHRGAMGHAPENTLEAIQIALDMGVDWIEIDVYAVENDMVVIHDDDLDRTTNGTGAVMDHTLAHLRSLDAGNGQQIPLLSEVVNLIDGRVGLNIELKGPGTAAPVIHYLDNHLPAPWRAEQILLSSFDHAELMEAKKINPKYKRAALFWTGEIDYDFVLNDLEAVGINPSLRMVTKKMVDTAHSHGLSVLVYTVNEKLDMERMRHMGVDGIFTNYPDRALDTNRHEKINYVELPAVNLPATKAFFTAAFGWSFRDFGPAYCDFSGEGLDGGFFQSDQKARADEGSALVVFYSDDLEGTQAKVVAAGGKIFREIFDFPGGRRFHFTEPSGNEFAVWGQPLSSD